MVYLPTQAGLVGLGSLAARRIDDHLGQRTTFGEKLQCNDAELGTSRSLATLHELREKFENPMIQLVAVSPRDAVASRHPTTIVSSLNG